MMALCSAVNCAVHRRSCCLHSSSHHSQLFVQNCDLCYTQPAFDAPVRRGPRRNIAMTFGVVKLEWFGYPTVKKSLRQQLLECDRQTDKHCMTIDECDIGRACAQHCAAKVKFNRLINQNLQNLAAVNMLLICCF